MKTRAVIAGEFDPITKGHLYGWKRMIAPVCYNERH